MKGRYSELRKKRDDNIKHQEKLCKELANNLFRTNKNIIGLSFIAHQTKVIKGLSGLKRNKAYGVTIWRSNRRSKK